MDTETLERLNKSIADGDGCAAWNKWRDEDPQPIDLSGAKLAGANLSGANLSDVNLSGADLSGANFVGAKLAGADFRSARLVKTNLDTARCNKADFSGADLNGADFGTADISWARFRNANLTGADVGRAKIWKTDFRDAKGTGDLTDEDTGGEYLTGKGGAYTFRFNDERIDTVCRKISQATGNQITLGDQVDPRQRVSFVAVQKSLVEVLDRLCRAAGLRMKKTGGSFGQESYYLSAGS